MSRLMRMTYGRSGGRLDGILVSIPHGETAMDPRWSTPALLTTWIVVTVLVCRFAMPKTMPQQTVIDTSRLAVEPPHEVLCPVIPKPPKIVPVVRPAEPPKKRDVTPPAVEKPATPIEQAKTIDRPTMTAQPTEQKRPAITRPTAPQLADEQVNQPRMLRERTRVATETGTPAEARIRRETAVRSAAPSAGIAISRTRGAAAADLTIGERRIVPSRQLAAAEGPSATGTGASRTFTRGARSSADVQGDATPHIAAGRERAHAAEAADGGGGAAAIGLARGISLDSLNICASPQEEENDITAVLSVIGSRQRCTNGKGEFQFKGTRRISSFNIIIFPANGRRVSNRCEELKNAYNCLATH
jgi:outer membrane biosynthesis protein TonB